MTRYGPPDVIQIRDVPAPVPRDNEVLVRVHASTVCYGDRMIRSGPLLVRLMNGIRRPKTRVLGVDLSLVEERYQPPDHPIRLQFPEGRYLKFYVLQAS